MEYVFHSTRVHYAPSTNRLVPTRVHYAPQTQSVLFLPYEMELIHSDYDTFAFPNLDFEVLQLIFNSTQFCMYNTAHTHCCIAGVSLSHYRFHNRTLADQFIETPFL